MWQLLGRSHGPELSQIPASTVTVAGLQSSHLSHQEGPIEKACAQVSEVVGQGMEQDNMAQTAQHRRRVWAGSAAAVHGRGWGNSTGCRRLPQKRRVPVRPGGPGLLHSRHHRASLLILQGVPCLCPSPLPSWLFLLFCRSSGPNRVFKRRHEEIEPACSHFPLNVPLTSAAHRILA